MGQPLSAHPKRVEEAAIRVTGLTVCVIGWLYLFGGRASGQQVVVASESAPFTSHELVF